MAFLAARFWGGAPRSLGMQLTPSHAGCFEEILVKAGGENVLIH